jgi:alkaline phosphatase
VTDATPAAFAAHVLDRYDREGVALQYAARDIEVLLGGGRVFFERRRDGRNLLQELRARYATATTPEQFAALDLSRTDHLLGLFGDSIAFPQIELRPTLPQLARAALRVLDRNPHGFFLLLESEDTDELAHDNDTLPRLMAGMRELDATVQVALEYQARHPETLIVVLGDHETGEVGLRMRRTGLALSYGSRDHSLEATLIFAGGPGASAFGQWLDNADVGKLLLRFVQRTSPDSDGREHPLH